MVNVFPPEIRRAAGGLHGAWTEAHPNLDTTDENTPLRMRRSLPSVTLTASGNQSEYFEPRAVRSFLHKLLSTAAGAHLPDVVSHVVIKGCPKTVTPAISPPFYQNTVVSQRGLSGGRPFQYLTGASDLFATVDHKCEWTVFTVR